MRRNVSVTYCILVVDPEGDEMYLRYGLRPGEGDIVRFYSREEAKERVEFLKIGMVEGEDFESISIVRYHDGLPEFDEAAHA